MRSEAWSRAEGAIRLLAVDPFGLGGVWLRARAGPVRDRFLAAAGAVAAVRRIHPSIGDDALFGGSAVYETFASGRLVRRAGILDAPAGLVLSSAERAPAGLVARLGGALDRGACHLIALDEGAEPAEALAEGLADRLAFHLDLGETGWRETDEIHPEDVSEARARRAAVRASREAVDALARVAARCGVGSLRAPILALRAARASAALSGRAEIGADDLAMAAELVIAPRAQIAPAEAEDESPPPEQRPGDEAPSDAASEREAIRAPEEVVLAAVLAALPPDLADRLAARRAARAGGAAQGAGAKRSGARRGRPLPPRPGALDGRARIDAAATLRAALPWRRLRAAPPSGGVPIRRQDIRLRRYEERSERTLIFVVDASGSAAFARLAETKGAIEILLARAYARRDLVALIAFRNLGAELLLPPTRALVSAKRRLASLPGGGGTPLAAGLAAAQRLATSEQGRGRAATIAVLTDGRANIDLSGAPDRASARRDAASLAGAIRAASVPSLVVDTGRRPDAAACELAERIGGRCFALPHADAARLSALVETVCDV